MVAGVCSTPGMSSSAKARVGGKARLSASKAVLAACSVGGSSRMVASRSPERDANAAMVRLKLVMRSLSCSSLAPRPAVVRCRPTMSLERSCGSVPSRAWLTSATPWKASAA